MRVCVCVFVCVCWGEGVTYSTGLSIMQLEGNISMKLLLITIQAVDAWPNLDMSPQTGMYSLDTTS